MLSSSTIHNLNRDCFCFPLDRDSIVDGLSAAVPDAAEQCESRLNLFARTGVLLGAEDVSLMTAVIETIETLVHSDQYLADKLKRAPVLQQWQGVSGDGLIMSYDFHINETGPKLIEVNTNAGGAFVVNELRSISQSIYPPCCGFGPLELNRGRLQSLLQQEWRSSGREGAPKTAVIVDDNPFEQYLYPDMQIARDYFERCAIKTQIADIAELEFESGVLSYRDEVIDVVYNRSTDFTLQDDSSRALRDAALCGAAVVAPNPLHHALYADKSNFIEWTDSEKLLRYGLSENQCELLQTHIPATRLVTVDNADELFESRKKLFFKPVDGFGSKAVYRGDKITRRVWRDLLDVVELGKGYIAQSIVPPTLRAVDVASENRRLKYDVRVYTSVGEPLIAAARIYQGQTTNFRTEGGGLAPVYVWSQVDGAKANADVYNDCQSSISMG